MKVLKESKENLPISFITTRLSDCWERIGNLKSEIEAINKEFKGTGKTEEILQDLMDAEIICAGRLQALLDSGKYLEFPEEAEDVKESLSEDLDEHTIVNVDKVVIEEPKVEVGLEDEIELKPDNADVEPTADLDAEAMMIMDEPQVATDGDNAFDMDFDIPIGKKLTDDELYGEN